MVTRGYQNQEFSSKIQAEFREVRGSRVFGTPKKVSSSLQEVGNLPTRVYISSKCYFCLG